MTTATTHYFLPETVEEAVALAKAHTPNFNFLAGGTDVMVNKFQGNSTASCFIDLSGIKSLKSVTTDGEQVKIGSLVRLSELEGQPVLLNSFPSLIQAANEVASPVIRKSATLGGNILCENRCIFYNQSEWWREAVGYCLKCDGDICIATGGKKHCFSKFVSDTVPVLIALKATLEIQDIDGSSILPLEELYTGDGLKPRTLTSTAIITSVNLALTEKWKCVFMKLRPREAVDFTSLTTAVAINTAGFIRMVMGGVDPKPILVEGHIDSDIPTLIQQAVKKPRIVDNDFYSRKYRKEMIGVFLERSLNSLINN